MSRGSPAPARLLPSIARLPGWKADKRQGGRMIKRLGSARPEVSPVGLGCMGMSGMYGPADERESIATIHAALDDPPRGGRAADRGPPDRVLARLARDRGRGAPR